MYEEPAFPGQYRPTYGEMTDPEGKGLSGEYDNGFLKHLWDARTGGADYEWYAGEVSKVIHPEGNSEELQYDNRHNVTAFIRHAKPGSGLADTSWTATYEQPPPGTGTTECPTRPRKICNKPLYEIDERSGRTDYTHDPNHGGVLTETGPAVGGIRPQTRYFYVQRYAWIKNASGGYSPASTPVWLLASKSLCKTGPASGTGCAAGASDEVVTTYDYGPDSGPNTLVLRGTVADSGGLALRTCYGYDWKGNRISETDPRGTAGLGSCP
jgi:hypothetical protein